MQPILTEQQFFGHYYIIQISVAPVGSFLLLFVGKFDPFPPTQFYQMELRWRFRDLIKCLKKEKKNGFNTYAVLRKFVMEAWLAASSSYEVWRKTLEFLLLHSGLY